MFCLAMGMFSFIFDAPILERFLRVSEYILKNTIMRETKNVATHSGNSLTLLGDPAVVGSMAPNFMAIDMQGKEVHLSDFAGKVVVLSVFPSIDTKVCAMQTRHFNKSATSFSSNVVVLSLSKDLPFALGRFCAAEGIDRVIPLSDYRESEFGLKYGFLIAENKLLSRGVVVIDSLGKIVYVEYVHNITSEPNYDAAISAIKGAK